MGGATEAEGRLQIYLNGIWGSVCEKGWGSKSSNVVCRELGYVRAVRTVQGTLYKYNDNVPVWLSDVQCQGTEKRMAECPHGPIGTHTCSHDHDIGIICSCKSHDLSHDVSHDMYYIFS